MRRTWKLAATAVLATATLVGGAGAAHAASYNLSWQHGQYDYYAFGTIKSSGTTVKLTVTDALSDGHSAVLEYNNPSLSIQGKVWDHSGSADDTPGTKTLSGYTSSTIYARLCIGEWSTKKIISCQGSVQPYPV